MIKYITGDLLKSGAVALVNTVNTVGVMGKGIALQFKKQYPHNYKEYVKVCKSEDLNIGDLLVVEENTLLYGKQYIINFPTKKHWRNPSKYEYIEAGLKSLVKIIEDKEIKSIAIPPLGAGNGGLDWNQVKEILERHLNTVDCEILLYQPNFVVKETLRKERVKLTPARAMLLAVFYDLVQEGEFVSEFAGEKIAYFLQRFGAKEFNLKYKAHFYGPYSGKVNHVLHYLNGSYIMGYESKNKKPFDPLGLIEEAKEEVLSFLDKKENERYKEIVLQTQNFLRGFYSFFGLELLSTLDFIKESKGVSDLEDIKKELFEWSHRKQNMFAKDVFINKGLNHLSKMNEV